MRPYGLLSLCARCDGSGDVRGRVALRTCELCRGFGVAPTTAAEKHAKARTLATAADGGLLAERDARGAR